MLRMYLDGTYPFSRQYISASAGDRPSMAAALLSSRKETIFQGPTASAEYTTESNQLTDIHLRFRNYTGKVPQKN
jgi:hypothetical protein